jgi:hypothetical protein
LWTSCSSESSFQSEGGGRLVGLADHCPLAVEELTVEEKAGRKVRFSCETNAQVDESQEEAFEVPSSGVSYLKSSVEHSEAEGDGAVASQRVRLKA